MSTPLHTLSVYVVNEWLQVDLNCNAAEGSACRMTCPDGCDSWLVDEHEHELVDYGQCLAVEWAENTTVAECHSGGTTRLHDGMPVDVEWTGDGWTWNAVAS